jgi:hypothetical protein
MQEGRQRLLYAGIYFAASCPDWHQTNLSGRYPDYVMVTQLQQIVGLMQLKKWLSISRIFSVSENKSLSLHEFSMSKRKMQPSAKPTIAVITSLDFKLGD